MLVGAILSGIGGGLVLSSGGSGGGIGPMTVPPKVTTLQTVKAITATVKAKDTAWIYDPVKNTWKLNMKVFGLDVPATNGFYVIENDRDTIVDGVTITNTTSETYFFDESGNMVTGWVGTKDGKWYYFEDTLNKDEGKMVNYGWKSVMGIWYYFMTDGAMLTNGITPDGFLVGSDGKWIKYQ